MTYAVVATAVLLSVDVIVPAYTVLPKLTIPENVGATNGALLFNAVCVADEITLSKSVVFSTFDNPKFALAFVAFTAPVPPFTTATIPVTFVAVPLNVPDNDVAAKFVVIILDAEISVALKLPENVFAVITLPAKLPLPSLSTNVFITLFCVAAVVKSTELCISGTPKEPNLIILGASAVPPKSPANLIFPFAVVVASGNAF